MYELVIAVGNEYNNKKILKKGSYGEICEETSQFNDTNELREKYANEVDEFLTNYPSTKSGNIVVIQPLIDQIQNENPNDLPNYSSKEEKYIPHKVIYTSDKKQFEKLLIIPKSNDSVYHEWEDFWYSLKRGMGSKKVLPTLENKDKVESINNKIHQNDIEFNNCTKRFNILLNKFPQWFRIAFYPYDTRFKRRLFPDFKKIIKEDSNLYYQLAEIVLKAFEKYVAVYKLQGNDANKMFGRYLDIQNKSKHKVKKKLVLQKNNELAKPIFINEDEVTDELARYETELPDYMHTPDYLRIKPFIDTKDVVEIKKYFELNFPVNMTQDELDEIQEIINPSRKVK